MVPIPKEPVEGINVKLEAVIPIEVADALDTKVRYCGVDELEVEILNAEPPEIQARPVPVEERTDPAVPTVPPAEI